MQPVPPRRLMPTLLSGERAHDHPHRTAGVAL